MALIINHNLMATSAARNLNSAFNSLATPTRRLSSGLRSAATSESEVRTGVEATQTAAAPAGQSGGAILSATDATGEVTTGESTAATLLNGVA